MILTRTIDNKKYTLERFHYDLISGTGSIYVQFVIENMENGESVTKRYYGHNLSQEMVVAVLIALDEHFGQIMVDNLIELNA
jgi:phage protein U